MPSRYVCSTSIGQVCVVRTVVRSQDVKIQNNYFYLDLHTCVPSRYVFYRGSQDVVRVYGTK